MPSRQANDAVVCMYLSSKQCVVGSNPTRAALFFFSEKKELFGLVAFPFFLFIEKSFHVITQLGV